jgi:hypothetical protein
MLFSGRRCRLGALNVRKKWGDMDALWSSGYDNERLGRAMRLKGEE